MTYPQIGADGGSFPEIAAHAVQSTAQQNPAAAYGYLRSEAQGGQAQQKIYLFHGLDDGRGWFAALVHGQAQPYDYAAVFAAEDLSRPVPGLESFGHTAVSGDAYVGNVLPFLLGLPLGAAAGYFYRGWHDKTGEWFPKLAGDPSVGGPWVDLEGPQVGGPWVDLQGPQVGGPWVDLQGPQVGGPWVDMVGGPWVDVVGARAPQGLIASATNEVLEASKTHPAAAYIWTMDAPSGQTARGVVFESPTSVDAFDSLADALERLNQISQTEHVAHALFDRHSAHWPHAVRWYKNDNPAYESVIAMQAAKGSPGTRSAGAYVGAMGAIGAYTAVGSALDDVRDRAQSIANKRAGQVIGVIHTTKDDHWHALAFRDTDDADDWLATSTQDPASFTYAAYYDKDDASWPRAYVEKVSGMRSAPGTGTPRRSSTGRWA